MYIPELAFFVFQGAFACITCALIVGAFAERVKFAGVMLFTVLWFTFAYLPMAHMVWFFLVRMRSLSTDAVDGVLASRAIWPKAKGAGFRWRTVVHINATVAGLVGAFVIGKTHRLRPRGDQARTTSRRRWSARRSWWSGWFGFNAGSALEAGGVAAIAFVNTFRPRPRRWWRG